MRKRGQAEKRTGTGETIRLPSEHQIQCALFEYINHKYPFPEYPIFAVPNEGGFGKDAIIRGVLRRKEGQRKGVSDIIVAIPNATHNGLFLEAKSLKGRLSVEQVQFLCEVAKRGYAAEVFYTLDEGIKILDNYLSTAKPKLFK